MKAFISKITPLHPASVFLQWVLEDVTEAGTFLFNVYRSGSSGGPWTTVATGETGYTFTDPLNTEDARVLSLARDIYYYIKCTPPSGAGNAVNSPVINLDGLVEYAVNAPIEAVGYVINADGQYEPNPNTKLTHQPPTTAGRKRMLKRAMVRHHYIGLKKLFGVEFYLLKRRHWGTRCTTCYDTNTREVLYANCPVCYGTSWQGGYFTAISLLGKRMPSVVQSQTEPTSKTDVRMAQIQLLDFPQVDEGDVLVEKHANRRWIVKSRSEITLKNMLVAQVLSVSEIARTEIEYTITVTL